MIKRLYNGITRRLKRLKRDWRSPVLKGLANVPVIKPTLLGSISHDPEVFTQGLLCHNGRLYESGGQYGKSSLRELDMDGSLLRRRDIQGVFAEGIAILGDELVQLTWKENRALRYAFPSLEPRGYFHYDGQGWGLACDGSRFIMSNGTGALLIRDKAFNIIRKIRVSLDSRPINGLNELEFLDGRIYANTWASPFILDIDIHSGEVVKVMDCSELIDMEKPDDPSKMLNGIAHCMEKDLFYLTGKKWRNIFLVKAPGRDYPCETGTEDRLSSPPLL
jgi:glutamine cyclotransferase